MPDDLFNLPNTSGFTGYIAPGTSSTTGPAEPPKVGFEGLWQSGWQSITSTSASSSMGNASVTGTGAKADNLDNLPRLKRVRREVRFFKIG